MNNPFADFDEPAAAPVTEPTAPPTAARPQSTAPSETNEVSVTLKGGTGFDAPWVVVRASSIPSALAHLKTYTDELKELLDGTSKLGAYFARTGSQKPAGGSSAPAGPSAPANDRPAYQQAPSGQTKYCQHGEMTFKSGVSKAGNTYKGFFCPERDRDAQCKPEFMK